MSLLWFHAQPGSSLAQSHVLLAISVRNLLEWLYLEGFWGLPVNDFEVVWDGSHNGRGDDSLLPPREERTNPIWDWHNIGMVEHILFNDRFGHNYQHQAGCSLAERIRLQILQHQYLRRPR